MRIERLPVIDEAEGVKSRVKKYLMALFLIGGLSESYAIVDALKEVLATVENAIYREKQRLR